MANTTIWTTRSTQFNCKGEVSASPFCRSLLTGNPESETDKRQCRTDFAINAYLHKKRLLSVSFC